MADGWRATETLPSLDGGELQIWRIDLAAAAKLVEVYRQFLSVEEHERAARMRAEHVRTQFVVARACLRILVGNLQGTEPAKVPMELNDYGKPQMVAGGKPLRFNLAHSRDTVLIALSRDTPVGIDLEHLDRKTDALEIARRFFTEDEGRQIEAAGDPEQQLRAFFRCWTRKEAVVKADGRGLSLPLTSFEVPVWADAESTLVRIAEAATAPDSSIVQWYVSDLALQPDIAAAFAVAIPELRPRTLIFPFRSVTGAAATA